MFYFEAQSAIIRGKLPTFSNFYNYKLPDSARERVDEAVRNVQVGDSGLEYPEDFLLWLKATELK